jgi:hypothetical protein
VTLRRWKNGATLLYKGRAAVQVPTLDAWHLDGCVHGSSPGLDLPAVGSSVTVPVSTGVLWRGIGISGLDLRKREARVILQRLLEEAEIQRAAGSGADTD